MSDADETKLPIARDFKEGTVGWRMAHLTLAELSVHALGKPGEEKQPSCYVGNGRGLCQQLIRPDLTPSRLPGGIPSVYVLRRSIDRAAIGPDLRSKIGFKLKKMFAGLKNELLMRPGEELFPASNPPAR